VSPLSDTQVIVITGASSGFGNLAAPGPAEAFTHLPAGQRQPWDCLQLQYTGQLRG
jgi:NADP-dependent 3-hydroxy acid dehydrogenase YdfG